MSDWIGLISLITGLAITIVGSVWTLAWWLSGQFTSIRNMVYLKMDEVQKAVLAKLEYHERHDDQRFGQVSDDLWAIKIRNAQVDGQKIQPKNG